eukprot:2613533-Prymnesium_polylepis.1
MRHTSGGTRHRGSRHGAHAPRYTSGGTRPGHARRRPALTAPLRPSPAAPMSCSATRRMRGAPSPFSGTRTFTTRRAVASCTSRRHPPARQTH